MNFDTFSVVVAHTTLIHSARLIIISCNLVHHDGSSQLNRNIHLVRLSFDLNGGRAKISRDSK